MNYPILNAKMLNLQTGETLIIKFRSAKLVEEPEFSGELRISSDYQFLAIDRIKAIQKVVAKIAPFVTEHYIK